MVTLDIEENVTTVATTSAEVHTILIGKAANAYVLVSVLNTTP